MAVDIPKSEPPLIERNTVDTDFLSSSHFTLAQDLSQVNGRMKSVSKLHFLNPDSQGKQGPSDRPALADIMHKDDNHFNDNFTETLESFQYRFLPKPELQYDHDTIGQTNFKMDSDTNKFNSFETIQKCHFPALVGPSHPPATRMVPNKNTSTSSIPKGDPTENHLNRSDYRDKFKGHDTRTVKVVRVTTSREGLPTLTGDKRLVQYETAHNDTFQGRWLPRVASIPMTRVISVPDGDKEKIDTKSSTMWDSYRQYPGKGGSNFVERKESMVKMRRSNHREKDGHDSWNDYYSVAKNAFPQKYTKVEKGKPRTERNHSDFPGGDLDLERSRERITNTTNNFHFGNPALDHVNPITVGAMILTKSKLVFGEPRLGSVYYDTSVGEVHKPMSIPYHRVPTNRDCALPFDYITGEEKTATTNKDFPNPNKKRLIPNPEMIRSLTESHIYAPLGRKHLFNTTHNDTFVSKTAPRHSYDPHKLLISSVPLGTLLPQTPRYGELCP